MRVLRVDSWEGRPGGGQDYIRAVADELHARGHEQRLVNLVREVPGAPRPDERYVRTSGSTLARAAEDLTVHGAVAVALEENVREFRPDLVHLHRFDAAFTTIAGWVARLEVPVVFTSHDAELVCPISTLILPDGRVCEGGVRPRCQFTGCDVGWGAPLNVWQRQIFDRWVAPKVQAFLSPNRSLAGYLDRHWYRPSVHLPPFARIPGAVRAAAPPYPSSSAPPVVGFMGRLEPYKGVADLLEAFVRVRARLPGARLDLAGDGPSRSSFEAQALRLGVADAVTWRGDLRGEAKDEWFATIRVLAVPSRGWENFGLVALEALTRGRPVVASDFGGLPDVVEEGASGHLVPVAAPGALATALLDLLEDPERAARWGAEGRARALERFTPEIHVDRLLAVYRAVLDGRPIVSNSRASDLLA